MRTCADCPTAVVSMSAKFEPHWSSAGSPELFSNGRIARDSSGAFTASMLAGALEWNIPDCRTHPPPAMTTANPTPIHFQGKAGLAGMAGATGGIEIDAKVGRAP